jgi:release factor glutamine methyltransferase
LPRQRAADPGTDQKISDLSLGSWRSTARQLAIDHNVPVEEVDWLLRELTGLDRLALRQALLQTQPVALPISVADLTQLWQRRIYDRVPVQYLAGTAPWRQFTLQVSPAVLIPRPETELLIDLAIAATQNSPTPHWADLGTGSGAIALGLATAFPRAQIHAVDCSPAALTIAQANANSYGLSDRIQFYSGSWLQPLAAWQGQLSGLVANPPYIPSQMVRSLEPEVAQHEPHLALDGGTDGLDCVRHLVETAPHYLRSGGVWLVELMAGQALAVADLLRHQGSYHEIQIHPDLAGIDRFVLAYRN